MIRLFTTAYPESCEKRRSEYAECLRRNLENPEISEVCLLVEGDGVKVPDSPKLRSRKIKRRPHYSDFFRWIAEFADSDDVSVISNTDIWFDKQLSFFRFWKMPGDSVFALSRWDLKEGFAPRHHDHNDSQDCWIFRGVPRDVFGDFPLGVARCDNRIAAEFERAGYRALNPSFTLRAYHVHDAPPRIYLAEEADHRIPPPYKYVWPHNLFSFPVYLYWRILHRKVRLTYQIDRRRLLWSLPIRVIRKVFSAFTQRHYHRTT